MAAGGPPKPVCEAVRFRLPLPSASSLAPSPMLEAELEVVPGPVATRCVLLGMAFDSPGFRCSAFRRLWWPWCSWNAREAVDLEVRVRFPAVTQRAFVACSLRCRRSQWLGPSLVRRCDRVRFPATARIICILRRGTVPTQFHTLGNPGAIPGSATTTHSRIAPVF
jgi:hypothetical protein